MARKSRRKRAARSSPASGAKLPRERVIDALLTLLAEKRLDEIGPSEIAREAGVSLAELREMFGSTLAILSALTKEIDRQVLAGGDAEMAEESPRERLFDVLMRRIEILEPRKDAVRSLLRSCARDPGLALALNGFVVRSQYWMLAAANIDAAGARGTLRAQGLALLFASVLRVWVNDDDPGHAQTMAALDRGLARAQRWSGFVDELCRLPRCLRGARRRRRDFDDREDESIAV
jgi:AcrR family transcriptional regulator